MRRLLMLLCLLGLLATPVLGEELKGGENQTVYFYAVDPEGDDYGPGSYVYPRNKAFQPYKGLFDLLAFKVLAGAEPEKIYFDVTIHTVTNPWAAPEGFIHPVVHIYISTDKNGWVQPLDPGPKVVFNQKYPWRYALTAIGWESSALYYPNAQGKLEKTGLSPQVLGDGRTIRLQVPEKLIGRPKKDWRYYVLVGSYDGFGPGFFRDIKQESGDWVFGGGLESEGEPRVLDLLAPATGKYAQNKQLQIGAEGKTVCLYPMGQKTGHRLSWPLAALAVFILGAVVAKIRSPKIVGFWLKGKEEKKAK